MGRPERCGLGEDEDEEDEDEVEERGIREVL
jgi:hypothetical protein